MTKIGAKVEFFSRIRSGKSGSSEAQGRTGRRISVVIPAHNTADYLGACLKSLANQTMPPDEIIVVDDASQDGTAQVARSHGIEPIVLRRNGGAGYARDVGVRKSSGDIIAFIDSDCIAPTRWVESLVEEFDRDTSLGAVGGRYRHPPQCSVFALIAKVEEEYAHHELARHPDKSNPPAGNSAFLRKAWDSARSGCESYIFRGVNSGEDELLFNEVRRTFRVKYVHSLIVDHQARSAKGYLRRHINRGRSLGLRLAKNMLGDTKGGLQCYGGFRLLLASALAGILPSILLMLLYAPVPVTGAAALIVVALRWSARDFLTFVATEIETAPGRAPTKWQILSILAILPLRSACWLLGTALYLTRHAWLQVRQVANVVVSIGHFWVPGRISRLFYFVTAKCNARCAFCFNLNNVETWNKRKELSLNEIRRITQSLGRMPYLNISGGEPFMRKDLADVVEFFHVHSKTQWVTIPTNAALTKAVLDVTQEILTRCPTLFVTIQVSIDGLREEHDRSRKILGGFEAMESTLAALSKIRPYYPNLRIQVATLFDDANLHQIPQIIEHCRKNFEYDQQLFYLIRESGQRITQARSHLIRPYLDLLDENERYEWGARRGTLWHRAVRALQGLTYGDMVKIRLRGEYLRRCFATRKFVTLYEDGSVSPCEVLEHTRFGNLRDCSYDYYRLMETPKVQRYFESAIVAGKCNCDWMCAIPMNMLYDYPMVMRAAKATMGPQQRQLWVE